MNFADNLTHFAQSQPHKQAVLYPQSRDPVGRVAYTHLTYNQLNACCDSIAHYLKSIGVKKGMRVSVMIKPNLDFLPLIYSLFKLGAIPILIDPGMGKTNLLNCLAAAKPEAFIGIPLAFLLKRLYPKYFKSITIYVTTGKFALGKHHRFDHFRGLTKETFPSEQVKDSAPSAIIFTTGSTGPPKGVLFTHGMFQAQTRTIQEHFKITTSDTDMPGFALFALFSIAMGVTVVLPEMDPTRPAQVDPEKILEAIHNFGVTYSFGSPALWNRVSHHCEQHGITLPSIKKIFMAGAPVSPVLHQRLLTKILSPQAQVFTPYGATESLLVSSFSGSEVLTETWENTKIGKGYCVGKPFPAVQVKIIQIQDKPITLINDISELPCGEIGEIIIKSPMVSSSYFEMPLQDEVHKIHDSNEESNPSLWHRIGDVGYLDEKGRLWFCGRKAHRVETGERTMFTVCCEAIFNEHPDIYRSALVGVGKRRDRQIPAIVVEPFAEKFPENGNNKKKLIRELAELAQKNELTIPIKHILFYRNFPVDVRHNAKIFREKLALWAEKKLKL